MSVRKLPYRLFIAVIGLLVLSACGNQSGDNQLVTSVTSVTKVPASVLLLPPDGTLRAYVGVGDAEQIQQLVEMEISGDTATATISGLPREIFSVVVLYEFTDSSGNTFVLASAVKTVDLSSGVASVAFAATDYDTASHDDDGDGLSNAEELVAGTALTAECILGFSLIGSCTL